MAIMPINFGGPAVDTYTPIANLGASFFGALDSARKRKREDETDALMKSALEADKGGTAATTTPAQPAQTGTLGALGKQATFSGNLPYASQYAGAIQSIESGGKYGIVSPPHPKYGRALGAYQVMEANLPQWSREAIGREVTPDEFLASKEIQDRIFNHKFGQYVEKYGNPEDAASAWFSGRPLAQAGNARDSLGTTVPAYVSKFSAALNGGKPVQVASLAPGLGYAPAQSPMPAIQVAARQGTVTPFADAVPGAMDAPSVGGMALPSVRPPMPVPAPSVARPDAPAPQAPVQVAQATAPQGQAAAAFGNMPPKLQAMLPALMANPNTAKLAEFYIKKYTPDAVQIVDGADGNKYLFNSRTQQFTRAPIPGKPVDNYVLETDERGNIVQRNTANNQRTVLDKAEGWQTFKGEDGVQYAWNPRKPDAKPLPLAAGGGFKDLITPEERTAAGVAKDYTGPVQRGPDGKLFYPNKAQAEVTINNNGDDKFRDTFATSQAKSFAEMQQDANEARVDLGRIRQLRSNMSKLPGGFLGGAQSLANQFGVKIGPNVSNVEAAEAIISQLVPAQRQGMPGAASDRDVAMFKAAIPKLSNTKEGNTLILDTMEALAVHRQRMGQIATKVATGRMTRQEAFDAIEALPDPFEGFRNSQSGETAPRLNQLKPGESITLPGGVKMTVE